MKQKYSPEMKTEMMNLSASVGCAEAARRLQIPAKVLYNMRCRMKMSGETVPEFKKATPKRVKTGIVTEEVIRTIIREKRNQYGADEKKEALILADMIGAAEAARELDMNPQTIRQWRYNRARKAKEEAKQKAAEEKENFFKETIVKLTQRVSALEAVIKSKFEKEKMA